MNRLTDIYNGMLHSQIVYDPLGRMTDKQADGQVVFANASFDATPGQPAQPHAIKCAETAEGVFPAAQQQITYTAFDKVKSISENGNDLIVNYGYDQQRIRSYLIVSDNRFINKDYVSLCEYNTEYFVDGGAIQTTFTYLVGPYGVFAVVEKHNNNQSIHYILKDHLGSWTTITDSEGNVEQEMSFDAWGNLRDPETWQNYSVAEPVETPMFDRGFTGHEHMTTFGLINMNGRCYDPLTSSFLSVDAYVQSPEDAQSFNRYAYCHNNPLRYVDPSGWYMLGAGYGTSFNNNPGWGESYSHHAYEPRELGMLQLPGCSVMTWWMEGEKMLGGGGSGGCSSSGDGGGSNLITNGGWFRNSNGQIQWSSSNQGINGEFLGLTYVENNTYYGLTGKCQSLDTFEGKIARLIELMIYNRVKYEIEDRNYVPRLYGPSEPQESSTDFSSINSYSVDYFGWGINNRIEFTYEGAKGYYYQYDLNSSVNENGIKGIFGSWPTEVSHLMTYGLPGEIIDGYHIFCPKTNANNNRIPIIILAFPDTELGKDNYQKFYNSVRHAYPQYIP